MIVTLVRAICLWGIIVSLLGMVDSIRPVDAHQPPGHGGGTLQALLDRAKRGDHLTVPPGVYRETITVKKPLTIDGAGAVEIRGSDVWTEWTGSGPWTSVKTVPVFTAPGTIEQYGFPTCADGTATTCNYPEQVWVDGVGVYKTSGTPGPGRFALDSQRRVILGDSPTARTVEVATRELWANLGGASALTIKNLTFRHSAGAYQVLAIATSRSDGITFDRVAAYDAGYGAIGVGGSRNLHVIASDLSKNRGMGLGGSSSVGFQMSDSTVTWNNRQLARYGGSDFFTGWGAQGLKLYRGSGALVQGSTFADNGGPGLWADTDVTNVTFRNNVAERNRSNGIEMETTPGPFVIANNTSRDNAGCGISVPLNQYAATATGQVTNNVLSGNAVSICKGYANTEVQPGVVYRGNSP